VPDVTISIATNPSPSISLGRGLERWVSPPTAGQDCPFTGLGAAYFYAKLLKPPFADYLVTASLRARAQTKGKRLIWLPSIDSMLRAHSNYGGSRDYDAVSQRFKIAANIVSSGWIRVPPNGKHCTFTGLGHSMFYALIERAGKHIEVADLRLPSETRAARLVEKASLHRFLVALAEGQAGGIED